jgi:uncharacterized Zn finger protein
MKTDIEKAVELANSGDWDQAHRIVQQMQDKTSYWLHANLHREEGDKNNAQYWYSRAGKPFSEESLQAEREQILASL